MLLWRDGAIVMLGLIKFDEFSFLQRVAGLERAGMMTTTYELL